jgi:hypothetical protein
MSKFSPLVTKFNEENIEVLRRGKGLVKNQRGFV